MHANVKNSPTCRMANIHFNELDESYSKLQQDLSKFQDSISLYATKYQTYLDMILSIPKFSLSHDQKYNEFIERFGNDYKTIQNYVVEDKEIYTLYLEAKQFADSFFDNDYDLYCHIINAEGGNCPADEQYEIAAIIDNRIMHPDFPNTLYKVVYSPGQYAPVMTGSINKVPSEGVCENMSLYLRGLVDVDVPSNVVFQAKFTQGSGVWKRRSSGHYFCYY